MATTRPGEGTHLQFKISTVYTTIGLLEEVDGPEVTAAAVKRTNLGSATHEYRKSRMPDPGKMTGKLQLDPNDTTHQLIYTRLTTGTTLDDFKLVFVDDMTTPANCTFSGFFTKFKVAGGKVEENLMADFEIQVTTLPVFTPGA